MTAIASVASVFSPNASATRATLGGECFGRILMFPSSSQNVICLRYGSGIIFIALSISKKLIFWGSTIGFHTRNSSPFSFV